MCVDEIKERENTCMKSFPFFGRGFEDWQLEWGRGESCFINSFMVEVILHIGCPEPWFLMFWLCARASLITESYSSNLCLRPPETPALSVQEIRRWNKNGFLSWWGNDKRGWCPLNHKCYHLKYGQNQKAGGCWFRQGQIELFQRHLKRSNELSW